MLVSEMEKKPEQTISRATAQICAHKGKASKRMCAPVARGVAMSCHYSRGDPSFRQRGAVVREGRECNGVQGICAGRG
ncbi:hypothetical protein AT302_05160 [Pandoraea norimbergensis]|uniref:Uncharacterized protein n=1 Tax=Pandoraea norimbergensis TaxID=93219 RepID=A0ABN4JE80_9BURK|nr:hypothetical protein AT302_05160 [Pandoraea norimbergensis]